MPAPPIRYLAALAATTVAAAGLYHLHRLRRALDAERAAGRLTSSLHTRDMDAFTHRLTQAVHAHHAVTQADLVLTEALAAHHNPEGGTR
ncbi:hypothetical protein OV320_2590 [Actinobacteria bacterium OV320]|nr:hypothetical protein OV320_2590 [Actinobacteria bacterium OV320]